MSFDHIFYLILKITFKYTVDEEEREITLSYRVRKLYADGSDHGYAWCRHWPGFKINNPKYEHESKCEMINKQSEYTYEKIWYDNGKQVQINRPNVRTYEYFDTEGNKIHDKLYEMMLIEIKHMFLYLYCHQLKQNDPEMKRCTEHILHTFITDEFGLSVGDFDFDNITEEHNIVKIETCTEIIPYDKW